MNCYTTRTGVRIGIAYQRPLSRELGVHAEVIQTVLLAPIEVGRRSWFWRLVRFVKILVSGGR